MSDFSRTKLAFTISLLTQQSEWHCPLNRMGLAIVSSVGESCVLFTSLVTTMRSQILHQKQCPLPLILTSTTAVSGRVWKRCRAQSPNPISRVRTVSWDRYQELAIFEGFGCAERNTIQLKRNCPNGNFQSKLPLDTVINSQKH